MPNRIIKESAFTSDKIAELSDFEFRLWVGLITQADDAGRGDARPAIIKGRVFALRAEVTPSDIEDALIRLAELECISYYRVGGKPYYSFPKWADHQRVRDVKPKYPGIEEADEVDTPVSISPQSAATRRKAPPSRARAESNPIQSESESESNIESNIRARTRLDVALDDFAEFRKKMKAPLTDKAKELLLAKLESLAPNDEDKKIAILNQSILKGWKGVFPLDEDRQGGQKKSLTFYDVAQEMQGRVSNDH